MQDPVVVEALSQDRLNGYAIKGGSNSDHDLLGRYLYNMAVSQTLYPFFHAIEVILRNRIHNAISTDRPIDPDRVDLYKQFPCWLDQTIPMLTPHHLLAVAKAKREVLGDLTRRYGGAAASARRLHTPGRLVARLPFGFWVFLFDRDYSSRGRGDLGVLWPRYSRAVFPNRSGSGSIALLRRRLRRLHVVRNRIMHYERIAPWADRFGALEPSRVRDDVLELLEWMEPRAGRGLRDYGTWDGAFTPEYERYLQWVARRV